MKLYLLLTQLKAMDDWSLQGPPLVHLNDVSEAIHIFQIHDNVPLEVVEILIMFFSILLLVNYERNVLSPHLMVIDDCAFQGEPSIHPSDVSKALHLHQLMFHWTWWKD
jgi:hypothetical protein